MLPCSIRAREGSVNARLEGQATLAHAAFFLVAASTVDLFGKPGTESLAERLQQGWATVL